MQQYQQKGQEVIEIDVLKLLRGLWKHAIAIILVGIIGASAAFSYTYYLVPKKYESSAMVYVNNSTVNLGSVNMSISSADLSAAQSLVNTYIVILESRTTMNAVVSRLNLPYSYKEMCDMVTASAVNDTEIFKITVNCTDAEEAEQIVNEIATVLPEKISDIVDGSSVRIVDYGVINHQRVSPSYTKNAAIGFFIGALIVAAIVALGEIMDDFIHGGDQMKDAFDIPVLAAIPDLNAKSSSKYYAKGGYYSKGYGSSYGYGYGYSQSAKKGEDQ